LPQKNQTENKNQKTLKFPYLPGDRKEGKRIHLFKSTAVLIRKKGTPGM
jgi:hypothetical protein